MNGRSILCAVLAACSSPAGRVDTVVDDLDDVHVASDETAGAAATPESTASPIDGAWIGACHGEVLPAGTTTSGQHEPTVLMCFIDLAEHPAGVLSGDFRFELWYSYSDWEYLTGEGDLILDGTLVGADVALDILSDTSTTSSRYEITGRFDLVLAGDALDGELVFTDLDGVEQSNVCGFTRND